MPEMPTFSFWKREDRDAVAVIEHDGTEHTVRNPNLVFLTRHTVILGILDGDEEIPERTLYCDTIHITRVETLAHEPPAE